MAKAKNTADKYNVFRLEMKSKTSEFTKEATRRKQQLIYALSGVEDVDIKGLSHKVTVKLAQKFREKNKDLIAEYKKLGAEYRKNEMQFQELFTIAKEIFNEYLDESSFREMLMGSYESKESKEKTEKLPELEDKNFRVERRKDRKEKRDPEGVKYWENIEGDIQEYAEGKYKGEQFFTGDELDPNGNVKKEGSATRETKKAGKKLPPSWTTYRDIVNKKYEGNYESFVKLENIMFPGWRYPYGKGFIGINRGFGLRCADGSYFNGGESWGDHSEGHKHYGFSVRCLKDYYGADAIIAVEVEAESIEANE